jgi:hypothetical protein
MESPNQSTVKTFLNVTIFKPLEKNPNVGLPEAKQIDITELLNENGVESFYNINGVSHCELNEGGEYGDVPAETRFVLDELTIRGIAKDFDRIIDAAIVNTNQAKAVKDLTHSVIDNLLRNCWDSIRG